MTKEEFLNIFKMKDLYCEQIRNLPIICTFSNTLYDSGTRISFCFHKKEIIITIISQDFSLKKERKELYLIFHLDKNNLKIIKEAGYDNSLFPHLTFENNLNADLNYVSETIYNFLIPKNRLTFNYSKICK